MATSQVPSSQTGVVQVPALREAGRRTFAEAVTFERPSTFQSPSIRSIATLASAGSTQANAAAISGLVPVYNVPDGDGTKGVILPDSPAGTEFTVYNNGAGTLRIYPPTGETINGGAANAALVLAAKGTSRLICIDGTNWAG